jgi:hypothetical protein
MQPVHDFPGVPADRDHLFGRARPGSLALADRGVAHLRIEFVGGFRMPVIMRSPMRMPDLPRMSQISRMVFS